MQRDALIDGFRGLSILLVIVGHLAKFRFQNYLQFRHIPSFTSTDEFITQLTLRVLYPLSDIGVNLLFIVSGFLITSLLLHEERMSGSINVLAFYTRRIFRILPAFFAYLFAIVALTLIGLVHVPYSDILRSGVFLTDLLDSRTIGSCLTRGA